MITILYAYRNREISRIKRSLDSLASQKKQNFRVVFVDYGSELSIAHEVLSLTKEYLFIQYYYLNTAHQPWNKSKAFNYVLKALDSEYCFTADVDMIFHPEFTSILEKECNPDKATYFQVGYMSDDENKKESVNYDDYNIKFLSTKEATGMTLFPVQWLKKIQGFDEFFHFWGAEDTEIHNRIRKTGCELVFYDQKVLMLHQWHTNYRNRETLQLNTELQLSRIVEINHCHLKYNSESEIENVNSEIWGEVISESDFNALEGFDNELVLSNKTEVIEHFLFVELPRFQNSILSVRFVEDDFQNSLKYKFKNRIGKKVPKYYSLKEINDKLLLHIISFYHQFPYTYKVSNDLKSISFKIKKTR
ncbi:glycosyltransferase family 2 protein [Flavobacterium pectinovorum]|uniref:glycosyltransferase family 2 protein n=1 Tax=Flavobacterium pectinovorum TaxID=29533 RepID=UPI001FAC97A2|nr:glycosyltransferase family 2 protein [Flavobacterium pectinovorum]MCI9843886.1 glycosyltransferase [Flavobacterium pectinovorum]